MAATTNGVVFNGASDVKYSSRPVPELGENDVLIDVYAGPVNPSDRYVVKGVYGFKPVPNFVGGEGSGTVIGAGSSAKAQSLIGKNVAFWSSVTTQGSWSERVVLSADYVADLGDKISLDQGACALVNPLTVEVILIRAQQHNAKAVVSTAAASQLGLMLIKLFAVNDIKVINVVRGAHNVDKVRAAGGEYVFDTDSASFDEDFKAAATSLDATVLFDAVGGSLGIKLFEAMVPGSTLYVYGLLSGEPYVVPFFLLLTRKTIRGLLVMEEIDTPAGFTKISDLVVKNLGSGLYGSTIAKKFPQTEFEAAVEAAPGLAREGKVLVVNPNYGKK